MSVIESLIYSFVSGIAEFLPVSSRAHQSLLRYMFGVDNDTYLADLAVHIGILLAIAVGFREILSRLRREKKAASVSHRRRVRSLDGRSYYDLRLLRTATVPLLFGLCVYPLTRDFVESLLILVCFLVANGGFLLFAAHCRHGNREARTMSGLDGAAMGLLGAASVLPGISRTGSISAYAVARGADHQNAANWAILLTIPATLSAIVFDLIGVIFFGGAAFSFAAAVGFLLVCAGSFLGGWLGIVFFQIVLNHSGFTGFAYYSFGAAFFSFVLYLIT